MYAKLYTPYEAFFTNIDTQEPPKLINFDDHCVSPHDTYAGFKVIQVGNTNMLEVFHNDLTFILTNVVLEITHTSAINYHIKPTESIPIQVNCDFHPWELPELVLAITLFGSTIIIDSKFTIEEVEPYKYKIQHAIYPDTYVHNIKCNFTSMLITKYEQTEFN